MLKVWLVLLIAVIAAARSYSQGSPAQNAAAPQIETVLVIGEQPGPALWKVSKDGHVLWIVSTFGPLSERVIWRSRQVEAILQDARELYTKPHFET